ncbi:MAG: hypothetical protein RMY28_009670 [Nostoc sp. ChiSLP01]|nr:transposase [Nostoc sp. CmiSLP01]MDZ8285178.1 transposase [Nostoc sp. ChiSLP01]
MKIFRFLEWLKPTLKQQKEEVSNEVEMWRSLVLQNICPECGAEGELYHIASGGAAENWQCGECKTKYWLCPIPDIGEVMGCKIIEKGNP